MNFGSILKKVGTSIIKNVIPGGEFAIDMVNKFLSEDKKLPPNATGEQVSQAIQLLPPEIQAQILSKEYDVQIAEINAWERIQGHLADADRAGSSTRPKISLMFAHVVSFVMIAFSSALVIQVYMGKAKIEEAWPLALALIAPAVELLRYYFGKRSNEKEERYHVATGVPAKAGIMENIVNLIRR